MRLAEPLIDPLYRYARRLAKTETEAEDLTQDTYLRAFVGFADMSTTEHFKAWMYKIMSNAFCSSYRSKKSRPAYTEIAVDNPDEENWLAEHQIHGDFCAGSAESEALSEITNEAVEEILEQIPEVYRAAVLLVYAQGLSYTEAAAMLDIPAGTLMSRLHRGRKLLKEAALSKAEPDVWFRLPDYLESTPQPVEAI